VDPDERLSRRLRTELGPALEPLTLSSATRERIVTQLVRTAGVGETGSSRPVWQSWGRRLAGAPVVAWRRPVWSAVGAAAIAAAVVAAVLVPRPGEPQRTTAGAARPPQAFAQIPSPRSPLAAAPSSGARHALPRGVTTPRKRLAPAATGGRTGGVPCLPGTPPARLVAPLHRSAGVAQPLAIGIVVSGGCPSQRPPLASLQEGRLAPVALGVSPVPAPQRAGGATLAPGLARYVVRWTGRTGSGRPLPVGPYQVTVRLPGPAATATIRVEVVKGR